jgi:hypothetical protein
LHKICNNFSALFQPPALFSSACSKHHQLFLSSSLSKHHQLSLCLTRFHAPPAIFFILALCCCLSNLPSHSASTLLSSSPFPSFGHCCQLPRHTLLSPS